MFSPPANLSVLRTFSETLQLGRADPMSVLHHYSHHSARTNLTMNSDKLSF